ncbi:MAG: sigma-E factor negative regulatory protein [Bacteroidetes bacterium]|nr:hypothetical protein [Bacteroidota bacterium]MCZ2132603.1 sigma-E factor negative regulatory protein [Bacteroidota bacterium]
MSAFNDMQPVEQLYAFMDGELDPFFENQLFGELAVNEDLRAEMKDLLTMREALRHDTLFPSPLVKERLLVSAGLATGAGTTVTYGLLSATRNVFSTWVAPILGVVLGTGAAALILLSHRPAEPSNAHITMPHNDKPILTFITPAERHNGFERTFATANEPKHTRRTTLHSRRAIASLFAGNSGGSIMESKTLPAQTDDNALNGNSVANETPNESDAKESVVSLGTADMQTNTASSSLHAIAKPVRTTRITADDDNDSHQGISIRFRGLFNQSFPASNISAESNSWINNTAFGAVFHFTPELAAGVEIGMERFAQVFGSAEGASEVWYEQNPQMLWAGILTQYKLMQIDRKMDAHIYGESFIGAAGTLGFLGRQSIGVNITPIPSLTVSAGAETAVLPYIYKSRWFSTEKFGFTVGLSFTPEGLR